MNITGCKSSKAHALLKRCGKDLQKCLDHYYTSSDFGEAKDDLMEIDLGTASPVLPNSRPNRSYGKNSSEPVWSSAAESRWPLRSMDVDDNAGLARNLHDWERRRENTRSYGSRTSGISPQPHLSSYPTSFNGRPTRLSVDRFDPHTISSNYLDSERKWRTDLLGTEFL